MRDILARIGQRPDCKVLPATGLPVLKDVRHKLPQDLTDFYIQCGGVMLFEGAEYPMTILPPTEFGLANPKIIGDFIRGVETNDRSWNWYVVAQGGSGEWMTIDLSNEFRGRCYDSFWDSHAVAGSTRIIAITFTELITRLFEGQGQRPFYLRDDFVAYGDAYD